MHFHKMKQNKNLPIYEIKAWDSSILESDFKEFSKPKPVYKREPIGKHIEKSKPELNIKNILKFYLNNSTIHGTNYLVDQNCNIIVRCLWGILIIAGLCGIYYTCNALQNSYQANAIKNIMVTGMLETDVLPFPAVVVCNNHYINWDKIELAEKKFLPANSTAKFKELFRNFLTGFEIDFLIEILYAKRFTKEQLEQLDFLNITDILEFLSFEVNEVIVHCRWKNVEMKCSDIFLKQRTQMGSCFMFNSIVESKYKRNMAKLYPTFKYPWACSASGKRSGLRIELIPQTSKNYPQKINKYDSFFIRTLDSDDWPAKRGDYIKAGTLNYFVIDQVLIEAENAIKNLPITVRNCIFNDEVIKDNHYLDYDSHYPICRINCRVKQIIKYCNCAPEHLIPITHFKACTASDYVCIAQNHSQISNYSFSVTDPSSDSTAGSCNCFVSCTIVLIDSELISRRNEISNKTIVDFHYRKDAMQKFQTLLSFSWLDYMVYFGGISSTFVGTSIMSAWEGIFYMFMIISAILYKFYSKFS